MKKIQSKTGIYKRWIVSENETAMDLAIKASKKLLHKTENIKIDTLIYVTQSQDYFLPTSACILQDKLNLQTNIKSFDINQGCSGYIYGLSMASSLIESLESKNVLLVCADTYSKYINQNDRSTKPIFSDGASATLITSSNQNDIGPFLFGTDGSKYNKLIVEEGASKNNYKKTNIKPSIYMDGPGIFLFTLNSVPQNILSLLDKSKTKIELVDKFIFHQASKLIIEELSDKLKIDSNKVPINLKNIGNTVSSSIPILLKDTYDENALNENDLLLLSGFGVGLSWGSCLIKWRNLI